MSKNNVRKEILSQRIKMPKEQAAIKSKEILEKLIKIEKFNSSKNILAYYPINNEVSTLSILDLYNDKNIYLPKVRTNSQLSIHIYNGISTLIIGSFGIMEPNNEETQDISIIDTVIVPIVAFDKNLHRIGYGGGYYDRFLSKLNNTYTIGLAYEFQKAGQIDYEYYDTALDMIITENNIYLPK